MTPDQCFDEMAVVLGLPTDTGYIAILDTMKKLKAENNKVKEEFKILNDFSPVDDYDGQAIVDWISKFFEQEDKRYELEKENEKLQTQIDNLKGDVKFWSDKAEVIKRDHDQLDENYKLHKKSADIYEEKLIEEIQILRKKPNI